MDEIVKLTQQRDRLLAALMGLVGAESKEDLQAMEAMVRFTPAPDTDKAVMINAIHVLLETLNVRS